jgi:O-antigen ligase
MSYEGGTKTVLIEGRASGKSIFVKTAWPIWILLLVSIPITSFPLVARFTGGSPVSPLAAIPALVLILVWLIPYVLSGGRIPSISISLLCFVLLAMLSSFLAPFLEIYPFKGHTLPEREIRAFMTLVLGLAFYFIAATIPQTDRQFRASLRWLYLGAGLTLLWSTVQIARLPYSFNPQPDTLREFHRLFSIRDLMRERVTGLAYEPSWLADQLAVLYIPLWLSSLMRKYSVFPVYRKRISIELVLLIWGLIVLFFTYSRIGLVAIVFMIGALLAFRSWRVINTLAEKRSRNSRLSKRKWQIMILIGFLVGFMLVVAGILFLAVLTNERIRGLFTIDLKEILTSERIPPIYNLANHLEYAERLLYWISSFLIFSHYPFFGVGLGNAGFFFRKYVPAFGYYLPEIIRTLGPYEATFVNPKSLWLRLLAETGLLGFLLFLSWLIIMGLGAWILSRAQDRLKSMLGLAGGLAMIALVFEGFSLDTFALPQLWVMFGFLTAGLIFPSAAKEIDRTQ